MKPGLAPRDRPLSALEERLVALAPTVEGWCARLGGPGVDAADAAHDVLLTLFRPGRVPEDVRVLEAWAFGVTRRVVANHRRRAWWRRWLPGAAEPASFRDALADLEELQLARRVASLLEELPAPQREVLVLCDVEDRSGAEVAALLGVPEGTVRSRLRLARARFRELAPRHDLGPVPEEDR